MIILLGKASFLSLCSGALLHITTGSAQAQVATPPAVQPSPIQSIAFFEPVSFPEVKQIAVYKDTSGNLYAAPTALNIEQDSVSVIYDGHNGTANRTSLSVKFRPTLSSTQEDKEVLDDIKKNYPDAKLNYLEPRLARLESVIVGERQIITPFTTTLRFGQDIYANIPISDNVSAFLLTGRTTDVAIGGLTLTYTIRGLELGLDGNRSVADRKVVIVGFINGGCARQAQSYVDAATGRTGCTVPIKYGSEEVSRLQIELQKVGYYAGPIDGIVGRLTRAGVRKAQGILNRPANGALDYWTVKYILSGELAKKISM